MVQEVINILSVHLEERSGHVERVLGGRRGCGVGIGIDIIGIGIGIGGLLVRGKSREEIVHKTRD